MINFLFLIFSATAVVSMALLVVLFVGLLGYIKTEGILITSNIVLGGLLVVLFYFNFTFIITGYRVDDLRKSLLSAISAIQRNRSV